VQRSFDQVIDEISADHVTRAVLAVLAGESMIEWPPRSGYRVVAEHRRAIAPEVDSIVRDQLQRAGDVLGRHSPWQRSLDSAGVSSLMGLSAGPIALWCGGRLGLVSRRAVSALQVAAGDIDATD